MRAVLWILALFSLSLTAAAFLVWDDYESPGPLVETKTVIIPRGAGFRGAADILGAEGVVRCPECFKIVAVATGKNRRFKAGEYRFPADISAAAAMEMIATGQVVQHKLTVPEGWRTAEVIALLAGEPLLAGTISADIAEGSLLPETYRFLYGDDRQAMIDRMQSDMRKLLASLWDKRKEGLPLATPREALTLASIVEKETGIDNERGRVAAVFINRLRRNMPLQSDPTVVYGIEQETGPMGRALLTADLSHGSPYNTYKNPGLPPGPICNPGRAALEAVLNPPETDDLYFVATGDGGHNFAATLKEHNKNVKNYRQVMVKKKRPR